mmetsp:Transcript_9906/g.30280  ORF Transcript_9906/g.30280 Transcript_9906/m.30280 type:complete len:156 (-) Transcript_9906:1251-1718(-)
MSSSLSFVDVFELRELDMVPSKDGKVKDKKFDKVSRLVAQSAGYNTEVTLDFNSQIFPMYEGDRFELVLSRSLSRTGEPDSGVFESSHEEGTSLMDDYDYVMHGKIFKYAEEGGNAIVYASYGGLLMALKGEARTLRPTSFEVGDTLYLLIKKLS